MKNFTLNLPKSIKILFFIVSVNLLSYKSFSQIQLSFTGTPTVTGTAGAVGAKYTYANIGTSGAITIKAEVNIVAITGGAVLISIDGTTTGSLNALQPVINGSQTTGNCWGIEFLINFFNASNNQPLTLSSFRSSGVDIDGDGGTLREYNKFYLPTTRTVENPTSLVLTYGGGEYTYTSPQTGYPGIALTQTNVAVSCLYNSKSSIRFQLGSCCVGGACTATGTNRLHSVNFFDAILFTNATTLPVKLISFSGYKNTQGILLNWKSAEELNLSRYILQYSSDGIFFTDFATINATGSNSAYSFLDNNIRNGAITYYRLKPVDIDGRTGFSNILTIKNNQVLKNDISATPNPFKSNFKITLQSDENQVVDFRLINTDGKLIKSIRRSVLKGVNIFDFENNASLPAGVYLLLANVDNKILAKTKIIKQ